jgi:hypothetical protein
MPPKTVHTPTPCFLPSTRLPMVRSLSANSRLRKRLAVIGLPAALPRMSPMEFWSGRTDL